MAELWNLKQESTEGLDSYYNWVIALLKNLDLVDGKIDNSHAKKHPLDTIFMGNYAGIYDTYLKRRI